MKPASLLPALCAALLCAACDGKTPPEPVPPTPPGPGGALAAWSTPEPVPLGLPETPFAPSLAAGAGGLYLVFHVGSPNPSEVYLTRRENGAWSAPLNLSNSAAPSSAPRIAMDAKGALHVVWGERTHSPTERGGGSATDVFYSTNESGAWSTPVSLYRTPLEGMSLPRTVAVDDGGGLHVVFSVLDAATRRPTVKYLQRKGGSWSGATSLAAGLQPDVAVLPGGGLRVVYIAPDSSGGSAAGNDVNSVFLIGSSDGGRTWSRPQLLSRSGSQAAHEPRIAAARDGRLHVLWLKDLTDPDVYPDVIWHVTSTDGERWSAPAQIVPAMSAVPRAIEAAPDGAGGMHVTFQVTSGLAVPPLRPFYTYWNGSEWSMPQHLFASERSGPPISLAQDGSGKLHLVLSAGDIGQGAGLFYSTGGVSR